MPVKNTKTLDAYRAAHDLNVIVPNKIRAALASLLKEGPESWEYESDFIRRAKISQTHMGQFRDQFAAHVVEPPAIGGSNSRRVWFADAKVAKKVRPNA